MGNKHLERDSLDMMQHPERWPCWPYLPLKNLQNRQPGRVPRCGVLIEVGMEDEHVYRFAADTTLYHNLKEAKFEPIELKQLINDGWEVD